MAWRQGQSYSEDLRARVLAAIDGGLAARAAASVFRVSVSYIYKALIRRRRTGEVSASWPPATQVDADTGSGPGEPYHSPPGPHPGGIADLAAGRAQGSVEQRGDVVGGRPSWSII